MRLPAKIVLVFIFLLVAIVASLFYFQIVTVHHYKKYRDKNYEFADSVIQEACDMRSHDDPTISYDKCLQDYGLTP